MSVTSPQGFRAVGLACGLKPPPAKDLAIVVNDGCDDAISQAGRFTSNRFAAPPVVWSRASLSRGHVNPLPTLGWDFWDGSSVGGRGPTRAVVLNSGGANACTGPAGEKVVLQTANRAAAPLGIKNGQVLVCSTGLIGVPLNTDKLLPGIDQAVTELADSPQAGLAAAEAIMTTDTRPKTVEQTSSIGGYTIGGMAKGSGMLAPELATMLVVLTTDAKISTGLAERALNEACTQTFDRIDSDGCMSTNDTVILMSSGASGHTPDPAEFTAQLTLACHNLARQLIADAEGADHEIAVNVIGAADQAGALAVARAIARSNLFKAAIYGKDANWGRILSAAGTIPDQVAPFDPYRVALSINGLRVVRDGQADQPRDLVDLSGRQVEVVLDLRQGNANATIWTNDLTKAYIDENSSYSS
jgi:glutamate N-acetyltransferase/amino-acid N-acetyltransferase